MVDVKLTKTDAVRLLAEERVVAAKAAVVASASAASVAFMALKEEVRSTVRALYSKEIHALRQACGTDQDCVITVHAHEEMDDATAVIHSHANEWESVFSFRVSVEFAGSGVLSARAAAYVQARSAHADAVGSVATLTAMKPAAQNDLARAVLERSEVGVGVLAALRALAKEDV